VKARSAPRAVKCAEPNSKIEKDFMNQKYQRYSDEADRISQGQQNAQTRARLQFLLSAMSTIREFKMDGSRETGNDEQRQASLRFREALLGEARTYAPMSLSGQPQIVPEDFSDRMAVLQLAAGPMFLGNQLFSNIERKNDQPLKVGVSTDLSAGVTQDENVTATEQELNFNKITLGTNDFSTGIMLLSNELVQDISSWTSVQNLILRTASARLSRRQNQQFIPALVTKLVANSSASIASATAGQVGGDDIASLVASVNGQYRSSDSAGFLLNSDTARQIYDIKGSDGLRIFKHVLDPKPTLLNYPCFVSDYADNIATGNHPLIFGDWSYMYSRQIPGFELQVMRERFLADGNFIGVILRQRGDMQYSVPSTSQSALKMLTIA
jgi:HK97 family phage major capsid protein